MAIVLNGTTGITAPDIDVTAQATDITTTGDITAVDATLSGDLAFDSGYGSVATAYGCRAWVNFNGTGTVAIRESGNVSSITDLGTGIYTVNFAGAMPDANYSVGAFAGPQNLANNYVNVCLNGGLSNSGFNASTLLQSSGSPTRTDFATVCISAFR